MSRQGSKFNFYTIILLLFVSCSSIRDKGRSSDASYSMSDFTECDLEVFVPAKTITTTLDSIIENTVSCERYTKLQIGFLFESYLDDQDKRIITVSNIVDLHEFYYGQCSGLFFYKGYQFALIGDIISEFFIPQGETEKVLYIALGREKNPKGRGEFFNSSWSYVFESGRLRNYYYTDCGKHWDSEESE